MSFLYVFFNNKLSVIPNITPDVSLIYFFNGVV